MTSSYPSNIYIWKINKQASKQANKHYRKCQENREFEVSLGHLVITVSRGKKFLEGKKKLHNYHQIQNKGFLFNDIIITLLSALLCEDLVYATKRFFFVTWKGMGSDWVKSFREDKPMVLAPTSMTPLCWKTSQQNIIPVWVNVICPHICSWMFWCIHYFVYV